jgi:hypothetical protein
MSAARVAVLLSLALVACDQPEGGVPEPAMLRPHRFNAVIATKQLGEEASTGGKDECLTGVVIHAAAHPDRGWYCSTYCKSAEQCPATWACSEILSGSPSVCVAPPSWSPRPAFPLAMGVGR